MESDLSVFSGGGDKLALLLGVLRNEEADLLESEAPLPQVPYVPYAAAVKMETGPAAASALVFRVGDIVEVYREQEEDWFLGKIDTVEKNKGLHVVFEEDSVSDEWYTHGENGRGGEQLMRRPVVRVGKRERTSTKEKREMLDVAVKGKSKAKKRRVGRALHPCLVNNCPHVTKTAQHLRQHQAGIHGIGVVFFPCDETGCSYRATRGHVLKRHKADIHDIGVVWNYCDQKGCSYRAKQAGTLRQHRANVHSVDVVFYPCTQKGCTYRAKESGDVKRHLAGIHDIGVTWHACTHRNCKYQAKQAGHLRQHLATVHGIGKKR